MASWLVLQLADSALPSGGFAHSSGLEAAVQAGLVRGARELSRFIDDALWQLGHGALPLVSAAHAAPARVAELARTADAILASHVANRASRAQGRGMLDATARAFGTPPLVAMKAAVADGTLLSHASPILGAIAAHLALTRREAHELTMHTALRALLSSAVRLGLVGPFEAQAIHHDAAPTLDRVLAACGDLGEEDLAQTSPIPELVGMTHDRQYVRLFQS